MAYDEGLAHRVRDLLREQPHLVEKKMFGSLTFILQGNLAVGVSGTDLMVRVGAENEPAYLQDPFARAFDKGGRPMKGWILVSAEGCAEDEDLQRWVQTGVEMALSLPEK